MKRSYIIFPLLISLFISSTSFAEVEIQAEGSMQRKLQRGFLNVALSPIEISNQLAKEKKNDTIPPSWLTGFGRGAVFMVGRALVGVYEIVTAPIPYPKDYQPVLYPEFAWEHLPEEPKN